MEKKRIAIIGNPSAGNIRALRTRLPEHQIIVVDEPKIPEITKYEARFSSYLFDRFVGFYNDKNSIAKVLKASNITFYDSLVKEYNLIQEKKSKLTCNARHAICYVYQQVHKD